MKPPSRFQQADPSNTITGRIAMTGPVEPADTRPLRGRAKAVRGLALALFLSGSLWGLAQNPNPPIGSTDIAPAAQAAPPPAAPAQRSTSDLEALVAPIALYPDPLIATLLPAAVYPIEIVQAARFVANTNNIARLDSQPWDTNVKAVAKFSLVIQKMSDDLDWTVALGQAFLDQPLDVMNAIQTMRTKAKAAGTLKTTPQQVVTTTNAVVDRTYEGQIVYVTNTVIQVQPASTNIVYVPTYNPSTVYVHEDDDDAAAAAVISFGVGMAFGAAMWGHCDWYYGGCYWGGYPPPPPPMPPPYRPPPGTAPPGNRPPGERPPGGRPPGERPPGERPPSAATTPTQRWQPDQSRLQTSGAPRATSQEARGWGSGSAAAARPSTGAAGARPSTGTVSPGARPTSGAARTGPTLSRPAPTPSPSFSGGSGGTSRSAFSGMQSGSSSRSFSSRGAASRGGGFSGGGRGGGRR